jgi:large subunit ribosomal protein L31
MKKQGHPPYQDILFVDSSTGFRFVCGSALQPKETEEFEGKRYPVYKVSVSSASHPFFTGSDKAVDSEGMMKKFANRYAKKPVQPKAPKEEVSKKTAVKKKTDKKNP